MMYSIADMAQRLKDNGDPTADEAWALTLLSRRRMSIEEWMAEDDRMLIASEAASKLPEKEKPSDEILKRYRNPSD